MKGVGQSNCLWVDIGKLRVDRNSNKIKMEKKNKSVKTNETNKTRDSTKCGNAVNSEQTTEKEFSENVLLHFGELEHGRWSWRKIDMIFYVDMLRDIYVQLWLEQFK